MSLSPEEQTRYDLWFQQVERHVRKATGLHVSDLPDVDFLSAWEDNEAPGAFAKRMLRELR